MPAILDTRLCESSCFIHPSQIEMVAHAINRDKYFLQNQALDRGLRHRKVHACTLFDKDRANPYF